MASESATQAPPAPVEQTIIEDPSLPFDALNDSQLRPLCSGSPMSIVNGNPKAYYGPVTIRNFIAGSTKKALRKASSKPSVSFVEVFSKLPIELQLSVLEHLHPMDLYQFSLVSKPFRRVIMDPKASGVWKTSFELHPDLPSPPPNVPASQWAFMIYGPGVCGVCGKLGALTDFGLLRRYCEPCMKDNFAYVNLLRDTWGNPVPVDHYIWTLLPRSYRYMGVRYTAAYAAISNAKFVRSDFEPMMKKVTLLQLLIDNGVPQLPELFEKYKLALSTHIEKVQSFTNDANTWAMDVYRLCSSDYDTLWRQHTELCKKKLQNLGHELQDIEYVSYSITLLLRTDHISKLTPKAFRKVRAKLEVLVTTRKEARLKVERQQLLENIYADYQKSLTPDEWQYLPQGRLVNEIEGFKEFLNAPFDKRGDIAPGSAASLFPAFVENWTKTQQEQTLQLFPTLEAAKEMDGAPVPPAQTFEEKLKRLELATSVITCSECKFKVKEGRVLLGWKNICRHRRSIVPGYTECCATLEINDNAVTAATALVSCVGLDPSTATIDDMNARDDRFFCNNCMSEPSRGIIGLRAYTWLDCLQHSVEMHINNDVMHNTPDWLLLTPEAKRFVQEHEAPHPDPSSEVWRCAHCAHNFLQQGTQDAIMEHAKKMHCIHTPVVGVDVVVDLRRRIRRRRPFRLGRSPAYEYRCKHCPELPIYKLWELSALQVHLLTKHNIALPVEGTDWHQVNIIAASPAAAPAPTTTTTEDAPSDTPQP